MRSYILGVVFFSLMGNGVCLAQNAKPDLSITNIEVVQTNPKVVNINFDVIDDDNEVDVFLYAGSKSDNAQSMLSNSSGDIERITAGASKNIVWQVPDSLENTSLYIRLIAKDINPIDISSIIARVNADSLQNLVQSIEGIRHQTNISFKNKVRDLIKLSFENNTDGLSTQDFQNGLGMNFIGRRMGVFSSKNISIVDAHYDTVSDAPGADDNGSGTAGFLEISRVTKDLLFESPVEFIAFDLEESGLLGSIHYNRNLAYPKEHYQGVLNFEMIGYTCDEPNCQSLPTGFNVLFPDAYQEVADGDFKGGFITNVGNEDSKNLGLCFDSMAAQYVPELQTISLAVPGNGSIAPDLRRSDHAPFWENGIPALMLTDGANFRNPNYHTPNDVASTLDYEFMQRVTQATLATLLKLASPFYGDMEEALISVPSGTGKAFPCVVDLRSQNASKEIVIGFEGCIVRDMDIEVYNIEGKSIYHSIITNVKDITIPIRDNWSGIKILRLTMDGQSMIQKIVLD